MNATINTELKRNLVAYIEAVNAQLAIKIALEIELRDKDNALSVANAEIARLNSLLTYLHTLITPHLAPTPPPA